MTFIGLLVKNLLRQRVRSLLTMVGIAIAITTVVALGVITAGMQATANGLVTTGGADFMVAQKGAADLSFSVLPESSVASVQKVPGVANARGAFLHITQAGSNPYFLLAGVAPGSLTAGEVDLVKGRMLGAGDPDGILLGSGAASALKADLGSTVVVSDHKFVVRGIYRSDVLWESTGGYAALPTVQRIAQRPGTITVAYVNLAPGASASAVRADIARRVPGVVSITGAGDYSQVDQGFVLLNAANVAISMLAIVIGGIGVMNTMIMSVFERTREIGVLRAVGWSGRRVLRMVLIESLLLCLVAAVVGCIAGVAAAKLVTMAPAVSGFIRPELTTKVFVQAVVVAVVVGLLGALYPAARAARLTPMEALRYE